jgi:hypothetical protein
MTDFPTIAFQASLGIGAILFGVFGFFYAAYAVYYSIAKPVPAEVVNSITFVCRVIVFLILFNALLSVVSLYFMHLSGVENILLGVGFVVLMLAVVGITAVWAFRIMK